MSVTACDTPAHSPAARVFQGYSVSSKTMDSSVACHGGEKARSTVLLVHGTGFPASVSWSGLYVPTLAAQGYRSCTVELPHIATGDIQVSSEYVARAIEHLARQYPGPLFMVTHSQGGLVARWALKYFPQTQHLVTAVVELGAPNHGTSVVPLLCKPGVSCQPALMQMRPGSSFLGALNQGSEIPGDTKYVSLYSTGDLIIRPVDPPTAALAGGVNASFEGICPGRKVDHSSMLYDPVVLDIVSAALTNPAAPAFASAQSHCADPIPRPPSMTPSQAEKASAVSPGPEPPIAKYATARG